MIPCHSNVTRCNKHCWMASDYLWLRWDEAFQVLEKRTAVPSGRGPSSAQEYCQEFLSQQLTSSWAIFGRGLFLVTRALFRWKSGTQSLTCSLLYSWKTSKGSSTTAQLCMMLKRLFCGDCAGNKAFSFQFWSCKTAWLVIRHWKSTAARQKSVTQCSSYALLPPNAIQQCIGTGNAGLYWTSNLQLSGVWRGL